MAKIDNRKPHQQSDLTLMNARIREKKKLIKFGRKPTTLSEWANLADELLAWSKLETSLNIDEFALMRNYGPHSIARWIHDNDYFATCWEMANYHIHLRRLKLLKDSDKMFHRYMALYDTRLGEHERDLKMVNKETEANGNVSVYIDGVKVEQKKDKE